jgi:hypothetical protein
MQTSKNFELNFLLESRKFIDGVKGGTQNKMGTLPQYLVNYQKVEIEIITNLFKKMKTKNAINYYNTHSFQ